MQCDGNFVRDEKITVYVLRINLKWNLSLKYSEIIWKMIGLTNISLLLKIET